MTRTLCEVLFLWGLSSVGLLACGSTEPERPRAAIMLSVTSNLAVPAELDAVQVRVYKDGQPLQDEGPKELGPGKVMLPAGFEIVPLGEQTLHLKIEVVGRLDGNDVSLQHITTNVPPGWRKELDARLEDERRAPAVEPQAVDPEDATEALVVPAIARLDMKLDALCQCVMTDSCPARTCEPAEYAFAELPLLRTSDIPEPADEGTVKASCFDVNQCFAAAMPLTRREGCSFEAPQGDGNLNLAFELAEPGSGFCDADRCLLPLDQGALTTNDWSEADDGSILLQGSACAALQLEQVGSLVGLLGDCPSKRPPDWLCPIEKVEDTSTGGQGGGGGIDTNSGGAGGAAPTHVVDANGPRVSEQAPFLTNVGDGVMVRTLMNVRESKVQPDFDLRGSPAGLGAFPNGDGTFSLLVSHDIYAMTGSVRAHGANGSFVSQWIVQNLQVLSGEDLGQQALLWDRESGGYSAARSGVELSRLGLADRASGSALLLAGEQSGSDGRAFAFAPDGDIWQLPLLGRASWGSVVARPTASTTAVVAALDNSANGQVYFYFGDKGAGGTALEQAGLVDGTLFGLVVNGQQAEGLDGLVDGPFQLVALDGVDSLNGADFEMLSTKRGLSQFDYPAGGAWDPANGDDFYFVTTSTSLSASRLWRLRFEDATDSELGGSIEMLLDGSESQRALRGLTLDGRGHVYLAESLEADDRLSRVLRYDLAQDTLTPVAEASTRFIVGQPDFVSNHDAVSAIIDASAVLAPGWFLLTVQMNPGNSDDTPGDGQVLALFDPASL